MRRYASRAVLRGTDLISLDSSVRAQQLPGVDGEATHLGTTCDPSRRAEISRAGALDSAALTAAESVTFEFECGSEGGQLDLTAAQQAEFKSDFHQDLERLEKWATQNRWPPLTTPALQVTVSHRYRISKSLVPAWDGRAGHMQFPAWRAVVRKAAIAHELVHVFWPNGNRFLAEGLAIYLQAVAGGNPAFPNFGRPLHELACERMLEMAPEDAAKHFGQIRLSELDAIATPSPLALKVGQDFYGEDARGQSHVYPIAGSFIRFLIETGGIEKFRALYLQTPLVPRALNGGVAGRWAGVYGRTLVDLEEQWKSMLDEHRQVVSPPSR
jgi:hypothetical protein